MQILMNGLISGGAIALLALAFQAAYLPTRVFFVGLAGIYSLAPFVVQSVLRNGGGWVIAVLSSFSICVGVSLLCEWGNHARLTRRGASDGAHLVASLGIYIIIVQVIALVWGNETQSLRSGIAPTFGLMGSILTSSQVITGIVSIVGITLFSSWLRFAKLGLRFKALADNPVQLALFGFNTDHLRLLAFGISGLLASISSLLIAYDIGFDPHVGLDALLLAVVAVIIGGRDSFWGPALAGILLGVVRMEIVWFFAARWQDAATFVLLVIFLFLRPQGIFGQKSRLEAQA